MPRVVGRLRFDAYNPNPPAPVAGETTISADDIGNFFVTPGDGGGRQQINLSTPTPWTQFGIYGRREVVQYFGATYMCNAAVGPVATPPPLDPSHWRFFGGTARSATSYVAASNAGVIARAVADFVCDGVDDHIQIQAALNNGGRTILSEGTFAMAAGVGVLTDGTLEGQGWSTILRCANSAGNYSVVVAGTSNCIVRNLKVDGNKANNAGASNQVLCYAPGTNIIIENVWVYNGISFGFFAESTSYGVRFINCLASDGTEGYRMRSGTSGIPRPTRYINCEAYNNTSTGMHNDSGTVILQSCQVTNNGANGLITNGAETIINGCVVRRNAQHGIDAAGADTQIINNFTAENGQAAHNTYANIVARGHNTLVDGNTVRRGTLTNKPGQGILLVTGSNMYYGTNDCLDGGNLISVQDSATNTRRAVKVQLTYNASTDIANGLAVPASTWKDISANQAFRVNSATSTVEISLMCSMLLGAGATTNTELAARLAIDAAGTLDAAGAANYNVNGELHDNGSFSNPAGGAVLKITGLGIGTHQVKLQVFGSFAGTAYCRAASVPNTEFLRIQVTEYE